MRVYICHKTQPSNVDQWDPDSVTQMKEVCGLQKALW